MTEHLHHLVIPRAVVGLRPGEPIYTTAESFAGCTYMGSSGVAIAMVPAGPLTLTLGDKRNAATVSIEMQGRDCYLHPEGRVSRVTPHWADLIEIREMSHEQKVELERWRQLTSRS